MNIPYSDHIWMCSSTQVTGADQEIFQRGGGEEENFERKIFVDTLIIHIKTRQICNSFSLLPFKRIVFQFITLPFSPLQIHQWVTKADDNQISIKDASQMKYRSYRYLKSDEIVYYQSKDNEKRLTKHHQTLSCSEIRRRIWYWIGNMPRVEENVDCWVVLVQYHSFPLLITDPQFPVQYHTFSIVHVNQGSIVFSTVSQFLHSKSKFHIFWNNPNFFLQ